MAAEEEKRDQEIKDWEDHLAGKGYKNKARGGVDSQREALERTRARLVESDLELSRSRRILRKMYTNVISNKVILIVIILIEIGILAGVLYWKYGRK